MTDHAAEQAMEIEALQAILMDDIEEYEGMLPPGWSTHAPTYKVTVRPADDDGGGGGDGGGAGDDEMALDLLFAHTPQYPDEPPSLKPRAVRGLSDAEVTELAALLDGVAAESLGMAMVYSLVTAAQEWLAGRAAARAGPDPDAERKAAEAAEEARHAALRAHGTPVTPESFAEWRAKFEAEAALGKASLAGGGGDAKGGSSAVAAAGERLTGKAWFMKQAAAGADISGTDEEEGAEEDDDEEVEDGTAQYAGGEGDDEDEDEDDEDFDPDDDDDDDDDDDEMLESYLKEASKGGKR